MYEVTDDGRVLSHKFGRVRELRPTPDTRGYLSVQLHDSGRFRTCRIHREVAKAFVENPQSKDYPNHIDGNKTNNHYTNLEWVTKSENTLHAYRLGLMDKSGTKNGRAKLNEEQVVEIRDLLSQGARQVDVAARFGIGQAQVSRIARRESWPKVS
jgi:hypothetical protein